MDKINENMNGPLFISDMDEIRYPRGVFNWVDEYFLVEFSNFCFNGRRLGRVLRMLFLPNSWSVRPCVNMMFNDDVI